MKKKEYEKSIDIKGQRYTKEPQKSTEKRFELTRKKHFVRLNNIHRPHIHEIVAYNDDNNNKKALKHIDIDIFPISTSEIAREQRLDRAETQTIEREVSA